MYPCCGLTLSDILCAQYSRHLFADARALRGCIPADHVPVPTKDDDGDDDDDDDTAVPLRLVDEVAILTDVKDLNQWQGIPETAFVMGPRNVTFEQVNSAESPFREVTFTVPQVVVDPVVDTPRLGEVVVTRDLNDAAIACVRAAYANPELHKRHETEVNRARMYRTNRDRELRPFINATALLADTEFLARWFTERQTDVLKVPMCVIRTVAPKQDGLTQAALMRQRTALDDARVITRY